MIPDGLDIFLSIAKPTSMGSVMEAGRSPPVSGVVVVGPPIGVFPFPHKFSFGLNLLGNAAGFRIADVKPGSDVAKGVEIDGHFLSPWCGAPPRC